MHVRATFCDLGGDVQEERVIFGGYEIADVGDYGCTVGNEEYGHDAADFRYLLRERIGDRFRNEVWRYVGRVANLR